MKKKIAIIGAGELGQQIAHLVEQGALYEISGYYDDVATIGTVVGKYSVLGSTNDLFSSFRANEFDELIIGVGYNHFVERKKLFEKYSTQIPFASIIDSSCLVDYTARIGKGVVIYQGCIIDRNVIIQDNVLLNLGVVVSHDSLIKSHSFIAPRVAIAGFTEIGQCCNIGINSTVIDHIKIADNVCTGGGSVIIRDVVQSGLYVGNPLRKIDIDNK